MGYNLTAELFAELAIGIVVAGVRLYTRCFFDKRGVYWDDLFLVLGVVRVRPNSCLIIALLTPCILGLLDFDDRDVVSLHRYECCDQRILY